MFMLDLTDDVLWMLAEAEYRAFGDGERTAVPGLSPVIVRLGVLLPKMDDGLQKQVLEALRLYVRRARILLGKEAPDRVIRGFACPACEDEQRGHRIMVQGAGVQGLVHWLRCAVG